MIEPQDCRDCASYYAWTETSGEMFAVCKHPKGDERLWGEDRADDRHGECPWFADREAIRAAVNGVDL